jgi:hypothetical protein
VGYERCHKGRQQSRYWCSAVVLNDVQLFTHFLHTQEQTSFAISPRSSCLPRCSLRCSCVLTANGCQQCCTGLAAQPVAAVVHAPPLLSKTCGTKAVHRQYTGRVRQSKGSIEAVQNARRSWRSANRHCCTSASTAQQDLRYKGSTKPVQRWYNDGKRQHTLIAINHCSARPAVQGSRKDSTMAVRGSTFSYKTTHCSARPAESKESYPAYKK